MIKVRGWGMYTKMSGGSYATAQNLGKRSRNGVTLGLHRVGDLLVAEFKKQVMAKRKHGRVYKLNRLVTHRASAKYETPANRTGHYRDMIGFYVSSGNLVFGNNARYAGFLEDGTRYMYPRYGLKNTLEKVPEQKVADTIMKAVMVSIR